MKIIIDHSAFCNQYNSEWDTDRFTRNLKSFISSATAHEFYISLNENSSHFPDALTQLRSLCNPDRIIILKQLERTFDNFGPESNKIKIAVSGAARRSIFRKVQPDVVDFGTTEAMRNDGAPYVSPRSTRYLSVLHATKKDAAALENHQYASALDLALRRSRLIITDSSWASKTIRSILEDSEQSFRIVYQTSEDAKYRLVNQETKEKTEEKRNICFISTNDIKNDWRRFFRSVLTLDPHLKWSCQISVICQHALAAVSVMKIAQEFGIEILIESFTFSDQATFATIAKSNLILINSSNGENDLLILQQIPSDIPLLISQNGVASDFAAGNPMLYDPTDHVCLTELITRVLTDKEFATNLVHSRQGLNLVINEYSFGKSLLSAYETVYRESYSERSHHAFSYDTGKKLLYFSPLPPLPTGVAEYSVQLIKSLSIYTNVICVVDQAEIANEWINENCQVVHHRNLELLRALSGIQIYNLGNSEYHFYMLRHMNELPGTVILHDVFLGHMLAWANWKGLISDHDIRNELYLSHGTTAIQVNQDLKFDKIIAKWPVSGFVFRKSISVVVHSKHAKDIISKFFGVSAETKSFVVSQVCQSSIFSDLKGKISVKLPIGALVVATFGMVTDHKYPIQLAEAWLKSSLSKNTEAYLVFVGEVSHPIEDKVQAALFGSDASRRVIFTGRVSDEIYHSYLFRSDIVVQLRRDSRGETSRAVLDVLAAGKSLILNAHGSASEYPADCVTLISDQLNVDELTVALERLAINDSLRAKIGSAAQRHIKEHHNGLTIAKELVNILKFGFDTPYHFEQQKLIEIAEIISSQDLPKNLVLPVSRAFTKGFVVDQPLQLFVDITVLADSDSHTGIQRVVKAVLSNLISTPPAGMRVEPVVLKNGRPFYARAFLNMHFGLNFADESFEDEVHYGPGDHYLGLDWVPDRYPAAGQWFACFRALGGRVSTVIYDLLPIASPQYFPENSYLYFKRWLDATIASSDNLVAISRTVKSELDNYIEAKHIRNHPVCCWFRLGSDLYDLPGSEPVFDSESKVDLPKGLTFLMVGSLEPRKGYVQVIEAFTHLWRSKRRFNLVIVGRNGWKFDDIMLSIANCGQSNNKLRLLSTASDSLLSYLYGTADALIAASYGEGFGLPLVEARRRGLAVIARDIPVFREVCPDAEAFFASHTPKDLADVIVKWEASRMQVRDLSSGVADVITWEQATESLVASIIPAAL